MSKMKRLRQWLFNLLAGVSLLLCVATVALWVRSYWVCDICGYIREESQGTTGYDQELTQVEWGRGGFQLLHLAIVYPGLEVRTTSIKSSFGHLAQHPRYPVAPNTMGRKIILGFSFGEGNIPNIPPPKTVWCRFILVPIWSLMTLTLILPVTWFIRWRRERLRPREGFCQVCGYDLRATPDRCPECGTEPTERMRAEG